MTGKTVLVTGGTGGIGRATAEGLAAIGVHVAITGRDLQTRASCGDADFRRDRSDGRRLRSGPVQPERLRHLADQIMAGAEEFVADDPFIVNGVIARYEIRDWDEILAH